MEVLIHKKFYKGEGEDFGKFCKQTYGKPMGKVIARRLEHARAANCLADLTVQGFPGRWHWLSGDREGQISADLDRMNRLIFEPTMSPAEYHVGGILHEENIKEIVLIEVVDTHD